MGALLDPTNGGVTAGGHPGLGDDASQVEHQLHNVQSLSSTVGAFAALRGDHTVICWGSTPIPFGDASQVQHKLHNVQMLSSTLDAFTALRGDHTVICWGHQ